MSPIVSWYYIPKPCTFLSLLRRLNVDPLLSHGDLGELYGEFSSVTVYGTTAWTGNRAGSDGGSCRSP